MSREIKKQKRQMKLLIIGSMCLLSVMTVGYAAFSTTLNISAKGNIVKNGTTSDTIKDKYCNASSGDGLYKDTIEEGRCIYKGVNINNYITFNGEEAGWRIISIEKDGTLKIIRNDSIGEKSIDNNGDEARISEYCIQSSNRGCNAWGSASTMLDSSGNNVDKMKRLYTETNTYALPDEESTMAKYLNSEYYNTLMGDAKKQIDNHLWNVGPVEYTNAEQTFEEDVIQEKNYKWRGNVGLISATDYARASKRCTRRNGCKVSREDSYLYREYDWWTMTPVAMDNGGATYRIWSYNAGISTINSSFSYNVHPVVFLKSDISLSGTGTKEDPYVIK